MSEEKYLTKKEFYKVNEKQMKSVQVAFDKVSRNDEDAFNSIFTALEETQKTLESLNNRIQTIEEVLIEQGVLKRI